MMENQRYRTVLKIAVWVCILLILSAGAWLLLADRLADSRKAAHMEQLQSQARPYETELRQIERELAAQENTIRTAPDITEFTLGFFPTSLQDMETIRQSVAGRGFSPVILLDCTQDYVILSQILEVCIRENYEMAAVCMNFDHTVLETAARIRQTISVYRPEARVPFLLKNAVDSDKNRDALIDQGFDWFFSYSRTFDAFGLYQTQYPFASYVNVQREDTAIKYAKLLPSYQTRILLILNFEEHRMSESLITEVLDLLDGSIASGSLQNASLTELYQNIQESENRAAEERRNYEADRASREDRIAELNAIVSEIYSHWDEY